MTVAGDSQGGLSYLALEKDSVTPVESFSKYITMQQDDKEWKVCLGGCQSKNGFQGAFRDFKVIM